jgi:CubicO group peptidase (beta-lactamase class C family)
MILNEGAVDGHRLLSPESVRQMTTNHLTASRRAVSLLLLEGQRWGFGGAVDVETIDPWNVPGRYGWVGGTGTKPTSRRLPARSPSCSRRWRRTIRSRPG